MKIAVVSKSDPAGGGASRVATELVARLRGAGIDVEHWIARQYGPVPHPVRQLHGEGALVRFVIRAGHAALRRLGAPELLPWERLNPGLSGLLKADLIHVHDIANAIAIDTLGWLARHRPVVWTLHDCSPFTGGCLSPRGCLRFQAACGNCPERGAWPLDGMFDLTGLLLAQRRRVLSQTRLWAAVPSDWMATMATSSGLFDQPTVITNGIDLDSFRPYLKDEARRSLVIDPERTVLAVASGSLADHRKGAREALIAARAATAARPLVLAIGKSAPSLRDAFPDLELRFTGFIADRRDLALHYSAADLLVYPSTADNAPLTVMESMACGTPVLGFADGGVPELVDSGENGLLVPTGDVPGLTRALLDALADRPRLARWGAAAVAKAAARFGWDRCLAEHLALYRRILAGTAGAAETDA